MKQAANHVFYELLNISKERNKPRITHLQGFEHFEGVKQAANHAFYEVLNMSKE